MAVDNLSSSPSFRELDDVFLQSQARIWVGEVLYTRFDEQLSISDLLSDGELLFEVSKALWNMLLVKFTNFKSCMFVSVDTRKSSGRYRPYSNADSFLKVCKVLGLSGVDLFSPSDVVEKKDTRKVCICIRSLSKKARSKHLNVPDFDIVTKTVAMPTEVVGCIRRSLELSTSTVSHGQNKHSTLKYFRQKSSSALHKQEDESFVEESDETKSNFSECSYADFLYFESPETVNKYALSQHSDTKNQQVDKSAESVFLEYVDSDNEVESRLIITPVTRSMCRISPTSTCSLDFDFDLRTLSPDLQQSGVFNLCNQSVLDLSDEACWDDAKSVDEDFESLNQISSNQETVGVKMSDLKRSYELVRCDDVLGYEKKQDDGVECMVEPNTNGKNNVENTLKTVAKGTALIGILFFLHIRNRSKKGSEIHWKSSGVVFSREKGNKIYPADKFKFGN